MADPLRIHILGNGVMACVAAIRLVTAGRALGLEPEVRIYGRSPVGGGLHRASSPRCQMWLHRQGVIYAQTQPDVSLALQHSTRILERLAPGCARTDVPAFAVEPPGSDTAEASFRALGIEHAPVPAPLAEAWLPGVALPEGSKVFRTRDTTLDLRWTMARLLERMRRLGVELVPQKVARLQRGPGIVSGLRGEDGTPIAVGPEDVVVVAAGTGTRPLLAASDLAVPGLRHFQSVLTAMPSPIGNRLVAVLRGGVNLVSHPVRDGRILAVFGNSRRVEIEPERDGARPEPDPREVELLRRDVAEQLGIPIEGDTSWAGIKAEIVPPRGVRSQAFHAHVVPSADNAWIVLPGKLSQAVGAADELARGVVRERLGVAVARSCWESGREEWANAG